MTRINRLAARIRRALAAGPCPYWTDYLHQVPRGR